MSESECLEYAYFGSAVRELAEQIADEYGRRDLLKFGARPDNLIDPPCVVGDKNQILT